MSGIFYLRDINEDDVETIFTWRNSEKIRNMMFTRETIKWENHIKWYKKASESGKCHLIKIIQYGDTPIGLVNFSDIDPISKECNWGFYTIRIPGVKGAGTALGKLSLEFLFEEMKVKKVIGEVLEVNTPSINFHKRFFFKECCDKRSIKIGESYFLVLRFELSENRWKEKRHIIMEE